ncbi:histidine N-alpha-methyltransferase-like [Saccoglossus kowalevskii]|uniref:Methyltransferase-33 domain-like protein 194 n=1 Tax=Saccoglossus kowalevskii TaxID=10224 RepID=A0A1L7H7N4_SACKO|nr:methyltransferase-33 domain-like protein 194 [Saccoglossus kowalevskii]
MQKKIKEGLLSTPKYVPQWYLYDTHGSKLFDKIAMENPSYHIYRIEKTMLEQYSDLIISDLGDDIVLCELGAGSLTKTTHIISALLKKNKDLTYIPIDIAEDFLLQNATVLQGRFDSVLKVEPFVGDYDDGLTYLRSVQKDKLLIFLGSSVSNIALSKMEIFLSRLFEAMGEKDRLLIGIDLTQDKDKLLAMYSDPETEIPFNLNLLTRLNREFNANFKRENFRLHCNYVIREDMRGTIEHAHYIQQALQSTCEQVVHLGTLDLTIRFREGELLYSHESANMSLKWSWEQFEDTMRRNGLYLEKTWSDDANSYGLALLKRM